MLNKQLISEVVGANLMENVINTEEKKYYITGPAIEADVKNKNGRIYPLPVAENFVRIFNERYVSQNRAVGELEHPDSASVNYQRASHKIIELTQRNNIFYMKAIILEAPSLGGIVRALMDQNVKMGVSSRGLGSLRGDVVQDDFELITIDIVSDPSAPSAFVDGIVEKKQDWLIQNGYITERKLKEYDDIKNNNSVKKAIDIIFSDFFMNLRQNGRN